MTSILTNVAANTALLNLESTNMNLQNIQNQISTGLSVSSAADNASYYSIATVLRSDSSALSTVSDALNLGGSSLNVASSALSQISTTLSDIKNQLLSAATPGVDRTQIQEQITQDQAQLKNIANSANFNGQNFLSVDSGATNYNATKEFISSFSRDSSGAISVGNIAINTATTALFDAAVTGAATQATTSLSANGVPGETTSGAVASQTANALGVTGLAIGGAVYNAGSNTLVDQHYTQDAQNTGQVFGVNISISNATANSTLNAAAAGAAQAAVSGTDVLGSVATSAGHEATLSGGTLTFYIAESTNAVSNPVQYYKYTATNLNGGGILDAVDGTTVGSYTDSLGNTTSSSINGTGVSIDNMSVATLTDSAADQATLNAYQKQVDAAISNVTSAAAALGTAQSRMTTQSSFISSLQTSLNDGIGSLVDADLNVASTRLQALQVQQQLGVQSLSIANQSTQAVLKLFQ